MYRGSDSTSVWIPVGTRRRPEFQGRIGRRRLGQWVRLLEMAAVTDNEIPDDPAIWKRGFGRNWDETRDFFVRAGELLRR
jgi:hypothetical protein